jgi:4-hydroxymandelate oxidase
VADVARVENLINLFDFEREANARLTAGVRDYYAGGAADEITLRENRDAWDRYAIHYRVLRGVARRDTSTTVLGLPLDWPVMAAPTAYHRMAHPDGELASMRAAASCGTALVLSTLSNYSMEEVARQATRGWWFQLYVYRDRAITRALLERAVAAGCTAIAVTVDAPVGARRERDIRNAFTYPLELPASNLLPLGDALASPSRAVGGFMGYVNALFDMNLDWQALEWLCSISRVPVIVKGIVRSDDAALAIQHGAAGVIVSNHGGRQLDSAPATVDVLARIVDAVDGRVPVLIDGGVRRGTDVLKALALGASAVLLGRPILWGLAVGGEDGVRRVLNILRDEFAIAMGLAGCRRISEITRDLVHPSAK